MSAFATKSATISEIESPVWLSSLLGKEVTSVDEIDMNGDGGLNATMKRLIIQFSDLSEIRLVAKIFKEGKWPASKDLGQPRECLFYQHLASDLNVPTPKVYFAYGNMETGEKIILLEDLSDCIQSGYYFGLFSPHNWGKDLEFITGNAHASTIEIAGKAFDLAARLHAKHWKNNQLVSFPWLRGINWFTGNGEASWMASQNMVINAWSAVSDKIKSDTYAVKWNPDLCLLINASLSKISYSAYVAHVSSHPFTLVHGDYHPANMMFKPTTRELIVLDWEQVGVGSGPQDVAQYMISHTDPSQRKTMERELLHTRYYNVLIANNPTIKTSFSFEDCYKEYVFGGLERWIWLLVYIANMPSCPTVVVQYFHDVVNQFMLDYATASPEFNYSVNPSSIGMPRV
jgi:hypothetical protein